MEGDDSGNCSKFDAEQHLVLGVIRPVMAFLYFILCAAILVQICRKMDKENFLHRLSLYLVLASIFYLVALGTQFVIAIDNTNSAFQNLCTGVAFLDLFASWIQLLMSIWIVAHLFFRYYMHNIQCCYKPEVEERRINQAGTERAHSKILRHCCGEARQFFVDEPRTLTEVLFVISIVTVALVFSVIPLLSGAYGKTPGWCWIQAKDENCQWNKAGRVEQWTLWYAEIILFEIFLVVFIVVFVASWCCNRAQKNFQDQNEQKYHQKYHQYLEIGEQPEANEQVQRNKKRDWAIVTMLSIYASLYLVCSISQVVIRSYLTATDRHEIGFWIAGAIIKPLVIVFIPTAMLGYLYTRGEWSASYGGERG